MEPFYIGKGVGNRLLVTRGRNPYWTHIYKKHGFIAEYLEHFETNAEALLYEVKMIKEYRDQGYNLANMTDGGEGIMGHRHSEETRLKLSIAMKGKQRRLGAKLSKETRLKISLANAGRQSRKGHKHSEETLRKIALAQKHLTGEQAYNYKGAVEATNIITGDTFILRGTADIEAHGFSSGHVASCITGKRKLHKQHTFKRINNDD